MAARIQVVKGIENNVKAAKPFEAKLRILDVGMMGFDIDARVEAGSGLFGNDGFCALDVFMPK